MAGEYHVENRRQACCDGAGSEEHLTILGCAIILVLVRDGFLLGCGEFNMGVLTRGGYDEIAEDKNKC